MITASTQVVKTAVTITNRAKSMITLKQAYQIITLRYMYWQHYYTFGKLFEIFKLKWCHHAHLLFLLDLKILAKYQ